MAKKLFALMAIDASADDGPVVSLFVGSEQEMRARNASFRDLAASLGLETSEGRAEDEWIVYPKADQGRGGAELLHIHLVSVGQDDPNDILDTLRQFAGNE